MSVITVVDQIYISSRKDVKQMDNIIQVLNPDFVRGIAVGITFGLAMPNLAKASLVHLRNKRFISKKRKEAIDHLVEKVLVSTIEETGNTETLNQISEGGNENGWK
jgi:hypothetical protein